MPRTVKSGQFRPFSQQNAMDSARANANFFNRPYIVYCDTNGNWRNESLASEEHVCFAIHYPSGAFLQSSVETTVKKLHKPELMVPTPAPPAGGPG